MSIIDTEKRDHQVFDDRAKSAIEYLLKTVLNLALASIGAYFFLAIKEIKPPLTSLQETLALFSIAMNGIVVFGTFGYALESYKKNQLRARALRDQDSRSYQRFEERISSLNKLRKWSVLLIIVCFSVGLIASFIFMVSRLSPGT